MATIRVGGADPSLTNTGLAKFDLNLATGLLTPIAIDLVVTEPQVTKQTRCNSDDLRRCQEITTRIHEFLSDCSMVFGEIPSGAQSARAAYAFGMVLGIWGGVSLKIPLVQVMPSETKVAATGSKHGSKDEIIAWAVKLYPKLQWRVYDRNFKTKKKGDLKDDNEHIADAVAVIHAGIKLAEFQRSVTMWKMAA